MEIKWKVADKKVNQIIKADQQRRTTKEEIKKLLEEVIQKAGERALEREGRYVEPQDLFTVLAKSRLELTRDFFNSLDIRPEDLEKKGIFS